MLGLFTAVFVKPPTVSQADEPAPAVNQPPTPTPISQIPDFAEKTDDQCARLDEAGLVLGGAEELWLRQVCARPLTGQPESPAPQSQPRSLLALGPDVPVNDPAGDTGDSRTQSTTTLAVNEVSGTICSAYIDSFHGIEEGRGFVGFSRSTNGGASFTDQADLEMPPVNYGNPSLVWRVTDSHFYLAAPLGGFDGMGIWRSTDDCQSFDFYGQTEMRWTYGVDDMNMLTADNNAASPYYGRLYLTYQGEYGQIMLSYSDNGADWEGDLTLSSLTSYTDKVQTPWTAVAPNGDLYVSWVNFIGDLSSPPWVYNVDVVRSHNGGQTFTAVSLPVSNAVVPTDPASTCAANPWDPFLPALNGNIRYYPAPPQLTIGADGVLHLVYSYDSDGYGVGDVVDVYYRRSTDSGATWEPEIKLNDDATITDQFFPTISVNEHGRVVATWYDRRNDPANNLLYETFMAVSTDNGQTWDANQQVSDEQSPVVLDPAITLCYHGFYDQQVQQDDNVYILWSDDRTGDADVWFESVPFPADFTLSAAPAVQDVCTSGSAVTNLALTAVQAFAQPVTLSASGQPAGANVTFGTNPVTPPSTPTMTIGNLGSATPGSYDITITGTAVTQTHTANVTLNVANAAPGTAVLLSPANGATDVPVLTTYSWTAVPNATSYTLEVATDAGFSNIVISETTDQTSLTPAFYLETGQTTYWRITTGNGCGTAVTPSASFQTLAAPAILLIDNDDDNPDVGSYYTDALDNLGYSYDLWDTQLGANQPTEADLAAYDMVIWYSGNLQTWQGQVGPTPATETALANYLAQDNCYLMSSVGYLNGNVTAFPSQYLGLRVHNYPYPEYPSVTGDWVVFGGLGPYNLVYPFGPPQVKGVYLNGLGHPAFTSAPDLAGSTMQTDFRSSYWGFPFEAIDGAANQEEVMDTAVTWCLNSVAYGSVAGTITDADYSWPIPGATVTADNGSLSVSFTSDANGEYNGDLRTGIYTVTVAATNYQSQTMQLTISNGLTEIEDFALQGASLSTAPASLEDTVTLGDVVTHTVTLTATGPLPADVSLTPYVTLDGRVYTIDSGRLQASYYNQDTPETVVDLAPVSSVSLAGDFMGDDFSQVFAIYENDPVAGGDEQFISVDTASGAVTIISNLPTPPGIESYTGMSYNPADGQMYVVSGSCDWFATSSTLYTIDTLTGELTEVGPIFSDFGSPCLVSIAFDPDGNLYAHDLGGGSLGQIDMNTYLFSAIGVPNVNAGGNTGLDWDPVSNQLYLSVYDAVLTQNQLRLVDTTTAQTTLVGVNGAAVPGIPSEVFMAWIAFAAAPADWVRANPANLTIPTNSTAVVDLTLDSRSLIMTGDYTAHLGFSGSFVNVVPSLPITMHVECATCGLLAGDILDAWSGDPIIATIQITNSNGINIELRGDSYLIAAQPGQYTVSASAPGYFAGEDIATAVTGSTTTTDLHLIPQAGLLSFAPESLATAAEIGQMVTRTVTVSNTGTIPMTFTVRMDNQDVPLALRNATLSAITGAPLSPDTPQMPPLPIQAYGLDLNAGVHNDARLTWFDLTTPDTLHYSDTLINHDSYGGDFLGNDFGTLYAYEEYRLTSIDTHTGEKTTIGPLPYTSEWSNYTGMAYDPSTATMYGTLGSCDFTGGGTTELMTIDVNTATAVSLGIIANAACIRDIAVDDLGIMYGVDVGNDVLVLIDPATVTAEIIGSLGFDVAVWAQGLDWDSATNQLYFVGMDFLFGTAWGLYRLDVQTGQAETVGALPMTAVFSGLAIASETATWAHLPVGELVVPNGTSATFDVVFDATRLYRSGEYAAEIVFEGTFINDAPTLPVSFQVACTNCGTLDGVLTDAVTGDPIYGRLHITGPDNFDITLTNQTSYNLTVQPGEYSITAESNGYLGQVETVTAVANATTTTDFALIPIATDISFAPGEFMVDVPLGTVLTETLTITNDGSAPFPFTVLDADTTVAITGTAVLTSCGGADGFGYACIDSHAPGGPVYNWVDISTTGTDMGLTGNNDYYFPIDLPFSFSYYGEHYSQVAVSSYGQIFFEDAYPDNDFVHQPLPVNMSTGVNAFIVPFWSSLLFEPWNNPHVYYEVQGIAPHRQLVIQFNNVTADWSYPITFQVILFEETGNILMQYGALNGATGSNATIGIQGDEFTATQYGYDTAVLSDNMAICYVHPDSSNTDCHMDVPTAGWMHQTPDNGVVDAYSTTAIDVLFDAVAITQTGTYTGYIYMGNSYAAPMIVPVVMNVVPQVYAMTLSGDDTASAAPGETAMYTLVVTNTGNMPDVYDIAATSGWVVSAPTSIALAAHESATITVVVEVPPSATEGEMDTAVITLTSQTDATITATATLTTTVVYYTFFFPVIFKAGN